MNFQVIMLYKFKKDMFQFNILKLDYFHQQYLNNKLLQLIKKSLNY